LKIKDYGRLYIEYSIEKIEAANIIKERAANRTLIHNKIDA